MKLEFKRKLKYFVKNIEGIKIKLLSGKQLFNLFQECNSSKNVSCECTKDIFATS